jgi:hypothetical protein
MTSENPAEEAGMLHLLVDTSTWLDLAKRRDGQKWIVAIRVFVHQKKLELLVPELVVDEFERNRPRIEASMTTSVAERFRSIRRDLADYGGEGHADARALIDALSHEVPLIGAMTTRNFDDILALLRAGKQLPATDADRGAAAQRGLDKRAPFHRPKNSVADALLIEAYTREVASADLAIQPHGFVTTNSDDFSLMHGDQREPHADLAPLFDDAGSSYGLGLDGLEQILRSNIGEELDEELEESDFVEEPRLLYEILEAENEYFDRVWYHRSLQRDIRLELEGKDDELKRTQAIAGPGRRRVEETYPEPGKLGPYTDFELGMLNGKLSALRWVLGSEWDFLDT